MTRIYFNEINPYKAQWLRNLIEAGHLPRGSVVDERSIEDVLPSEVATFDRCHFFAGIGGWGLALELAGWPDEAGRVWTCGCPCQPFSAAGKRGGFADERHLWPALYHLIGECGPDVLFGEQVASRDGLAWLDLVQADMEAAHYAGGAVDLCAAGFGAPHIRQRQWLTFERLADADSEGLEGRGIRGGGADQRPAGPDGVAGGLADAEVDSAANKPWRAEPEVERGAPEFKRTSGGTGGRNGGGSGAEGGVPYKTDRSGTVGAHSRTDRAAPVNGQWQAADWLYCSDGRWRPVEPGTFPLAHGVPGRVGRLRAYGETIVPAVAQAVAEAYLEHKGWVW